MKPNAPALVLAAALLASPSQAKTLDAAACAALTAPIPASAVGLPSGEADIDSAVFSPRARNMYCNGCTYGRSAR